MPRLAHSLRTASLATIILGGSLLPLGCGTDVSTEPIKPDLQAGKSQGQATADFYKSNPVPKK